MRKLLILVLTVFLALAVGCGKSGDNGQGDESNPHANPDDKQSAEKRSGEKRSGQKRGSDSQSGGEIDIDSLDIPDRMKEAIKSAAAQFSARRMVKEYVAKFYENALKNL